MPPFPILTDFFKRYIRIMLCRNDNIIQSYRTISIIFDRDLCFSIRTQIWQNAILTHLRQPFCQIGREHIAERHKSFCLITGISEHHSLITGADIILIVLLSYFCFKTPIHSERDVR